MITVRARKSILVLAVAVSVLIGTSGCMSLKELLGYTTTAEENHEFQESTARRFKEKFPATESIRFTNEGSISGAGSWAANAVVTIAGTEYQEIIGPRFTAGDPLPYSESLPPCESTIVYYSDGSTEVLQ